jgi:multimeric flavodoxin WrbA
MKALILDGSHPNDPTGERVKAALTAKMQACGWNVEYVLLRDKKIGNCAGDFFCWVRSPGVCNVDDDNREIAAAIVHSDLLAYLTPVTFGGYSSALKRMVDHELPNISPFFAKVNGETHHQKRYARYPDFLAIGWMDAPDAQAEAVFRHLAWRNGINMYAKTSVCGLVHASQPEAELAAQAETWLEAIARGTSSPRPALPKTDIFLADAGPVRRAVLLVGSPRTKKSTSNSLGGYLMEQLAAKGIQTETVYIHTSINSRERMQSLLETVDAADLAVLAFPLYIDSLPAPVIAALERIAAQRAGRATRQRFAAMVNCGFPEQHHNATALAICSEFARQAGFAWAGSLSLGAGEGMVHGTPLNELDGRASVLKQALDLAAEALAQGQAIPRAAQALWDKPFIPGWLYRLMGIYGWRQQAKQYGVENMLKRQPYAAK